MEILKVKYSIDRKEEFQIKTVIYQENRIKNVKKEAYSQKSINHIKTINTNYRLMQSSKMTLVKPILEEKSVIFQYIDGESVDSILIKYIMNKDIERFKKTLQWYKMLLLQEELVPFLVTEQFTKVFGDITNLEGIPSVQIANVDLNFDNLIKHDEQIMVIDYEWVFNFKVPLNYIIYRAIISFDVKYHMYLKNLISTAEVFEYLEIPVFELNAYKQMECSFSEYVGRDVSIYIKRYLKSNDNFQELLGNVTNDTIQELNLKINEVSSWGKQLESDIIYRDSQIVSLNEQLKKASQAIIKQQIDLEERDPLTLEQNKKINEVSLWGQSLYEQILERDRIIEDLNKQIAAISKRMK